MQAQETKHVTPVLSRLKLFPQFHSLQAPAGFELRSNWRTIVSPAMFATSPRSAPTCDGTYYCSVSALLESVQRTLQSALSLASVSDILVVEVQKKSTPSRRASMKLEWTSRFTRGTGLVVPRLVASESSLTCKCAILVLAGHPAISAGIPIAAPSGWIDALLCDVVAKCRTLRHLCCIVEGGSNAMFLRDCIEALSFFAVKCPLIDVSVVPLVNIKKTLFSSWHDGVVHLCVGSNNGGTRGVNCLQLLPSPSVGTVSQSLFPFMLRSALWGVICDSQSLGLVVELLAITVRYFDHCSKGDALGVAIAKMSRWFSTEGGALPTPVRRHLEHQACRWYARDVGSPLVEITNATNALATALPPWVEVVSSADSSPSVTLLVQAPAAMVRLLQAHGVDAQLWTHIDDSDEICSLLRCYGVTVTLEPLMRNDSRRAMQQLLFDVIPQAVSMTPRHQRGSDHRTVSLPRYDGVTAPNEKLLSTRHWSRDFPMLWFVLFGPIGAAASKL